MITLKSGAEIEEMRIAGRAVARILSGLERIVVPGITTAELDRFAEDQCRVFGVKPAFKGYRGFPATVCISINEEVVHGIPSSNRVLKEGDIVGLDFGVIYQGWYGDSARTVGVGRVSRAAVELMDITRESLMKGIEQCRKGHRLSDIGSAVQSYVEGFGYSVVKDFVGHGIGRSLHEDPQVPNYGTKGKGVRLEPGMVLAIEPMINMGRCEVKILNDGWTAVTADQSLSAHFEHTVAITPNGPDILTLDEVN